MTLLPSQRRVRNPCEAGGEQDPHVATAAGKIAVSFLGTGRWLSVIRGQANTPLPDRCWTASCVRKQAGQHCGWCVGGSLLTQVEEGHGPRERCRGCHPLLQPAGDRTNTPSPGTQVQAATGSTFCHRQEAGTLSPAQAGHESPSNPGPHGGRHPPRQRARPPVLGETPGGLYQAPRSSTPSRRKV